MSTLSQDGYQIHRKNFCADEIAGLRQEADRVSAEAGAACVRKLLERSRILADLAIAPRLKSLLPDGVNPVRAILFDKTREENWPVRWHQDLTIAVSRQAEIPGYGPWSIKDGTVHVQPPIAVLETMLTLRIHLDDTPVGNGALRVVPGSHRLGRIPSERIHEYVDDSAVVCACAAGDVLVMAPLLLHASRRSAAPTRRRVVHFEYARLSALDSRLSWQECRPCRADLRDFTPHPAFGRPGGKPEIGKGR